MLSPPEIKALHPWRKLRPYIAPTPLDLATPSLWSEDDETAVSASPRKPSGTYFWGALMRIDVLEAPSETQLVFYGPSSLKVSAEPLRMSPGDVTMPSGLPLTASAAELGSASSTAARQLPSASTSASAASMSSASHATERTTSPQPASSQQPGSKIPAPAGQNDRMVLDRRKGPKLRSAAEDDGQLFGVESVAARGGLVLAKKVSYLTIIWIHSEASWAALMHSNLRLPSHQPLAQRLT